MEKLVFINMKFIISENRINDLVVKHLDSMFDVANIGELGFHYESIGRASIN